jgi:cobalamin biosynthesis Mg chelatase CobN
VDARYITVNDLGRASDDNCCNRYEILIARETTDNTVDVDSSRNNVESSMAQEADFQIESSSVSSSNSQQTQNTDNTNSNTQTNNQRTTGSSTPESGAVSVSVSCLLCFALALLFCLF